MAVRWFGKEVYRVAEQAQRQALKKAALVVVRSVKENFGDAAEALGPLRNTRGRFRAPTAAERQANPSKPGEPPHIDTGTLKKSISYELIANDEEHVGPALGFNSQETGEPADHYGYWLEVGTPNMAARPYLKPALAREQQKILKIFRGIFNG